MSKTATTWLIIIIAIIVIALIWWWFASMPATNTTINTTVNAINSAKLIKSFGFEGFSPALNGVIDNANNTISFTVPKGTNVVNATPTILVSDNATVSPASGVAQNFTNPVTYTVTAQDGSSQSYTVTVIVAAE